MRNDVSSFSLCFSFAESIVLKIWPRVNRILTNDSDCQWFQSSSDHEEGGFRAFIVIDDGPARHGPSVVRLLPVSDTDNK
jgi:hypothetical protein